MVTNQPARNERNPYYLCSCMSIIATVLFVGSMYYGLESLIFRCALLLIISTFCVRCKIK